MKARYPGWCKGGGHAVGAGDEIVRDGAGWSHRDHLTARPANHPHYDGPAPSFAWTPRPTYDEFDQSAVWEAAEAARDRARDDAEYAAGVNDAKRWQENRAFFGQEAADAIEFDRDMRGLNGDW